MKHLRSRKATSALRGIPTALARHLSQESAFRVLRSRVPHRCRTTGWQPFRRCLSLSTSRSRTKRPTGCPRVLRRRPLTRRTTTSGRGGLPTRHQSQRVDAQLASCPVAASCSRQLSCQFSAHNLADPNVQHGLNWTQRRPAESDKELTTKR